MAPVIGLTPFVNTYELPSAFIRQPYLLARDCKILLCVPLSPIDRSDDRQVHQRHTKQLEQIERKRRRLRTRLMIEAQSRSEAHNQNRICDILQRQCVAKREQGIAAIFRRPAVAPVGFHLFACFGNDQLRKSAEVVSADAALVSTQRSNRSRARQWRQKFSHRADCLAHFRAVPACLTAGAQEKTQLPARSCFRQLSGQAQTQSRISQSLVLPNPSLHRSSA